MIASRKVFFCDQKFFSWKSRLRWNPYTSCVSIDFRNLKRTCEYTLWSQIWKIGNNGLASKPLYLSSYSVTFEDRLNYKCGLLCKGYYKNSSKETFRKEGEKIMMPIGTDEHYRHSHKVTYSLGGCINFIEDKNFFEVMWWMQMEPWGWGHSCQD